MLRVKTKQFTSGRPLVGSWDIGTSIGCEYNEPGRPRPDKDHSVSRLSTTRLYGSSLVSTKSPVVISYSLPLPGSVIFTKTGESTIKAFGYLFTARPRPLSCPDHNHYHDPLPKSDSDLVYRRWGTTLLGDGFCLFKGLY